MKRTKCEKPWITPEKEDPLTIQAEQEDEEVPDKDDNEKLQKIFNMNAYFCVPKSSTCVKPLMQKNTLTFQLETNKAEDESSSETSSSEKECFERSITEMFSSDELVEKSRSENERYERSRPVESNNDVLMITW